MADIYERMPDDPQEPERHYTGSVFIGNTSYSGADIKLVVHIYESDSRAKQRLEALHAEEGGIQDALEDLDGNTASIQKKLETAKQGTPAYENLQKQLTKNERERSALANSLESKFKDISRINTSDRNYGTQALADVQTISISSHRVKEPVRACGCVYPKGYVRGQRMIAGSMIFTVFNKHVLYDLLVAHPTDFDGVNFSSALLDQMPPMDITICFANEYGYQSRMAIYGVEFVNEGQTMSIEDIMTENAVQYVARDFDPLRPVGKVRMDTMIGQPIEYEYKTASSLILEDDYQKVASELNPFARHARRSNPFV